MRRLLWVLLACGAAACGATDDDGSDGGSSDSGTADGGGGTGVDIPTITVECSTTSCAAAPASGNIVFFAYMLEDCATARANPLATTEAAGRGAPYTCNAGICSGTSDDSPSAWDDEDDVDVTTIEPATYGAIAWFDHNGNIFAGGGPDAGDTICCAAAAVSAGTSSVNLLSAGCVDL